MTSVNPRIHLKKQDRTGFVRLIQGSRLNIPFSLLIKISCSPLKNKRKIIKIKRNWKRKEKVWIVTVLDFNLPKHYWIGVFSWNTLHKHSSTHPNGFGFSFRGVWCHLSEGGAAEIKNRSHIRVLVRICFNLDRSVCCFDEYLDFL